MIGVALERKQFPKLLEKLRIRKEDRVVGTDRRASKADALSS